MAWDFSSNVSAASSRAMWCALLNLLQVVASLRGLSKKAIVVEIRKVHDEPVSWCTIEI